MYHYLSENTKNNIKFIIRNELVQIRLTAKDIKFDSYIFSLGWKFKARIDETGDEIWVTYDETDLIQVEYPTISNEESKKHYIQCKENGIFDNIRNRVLVYLTKQDYNEDRDNIFTFEDIQSLRLLCESVIILWRNSNKYYTFQLVNDNTLEIYSNIKVEVKARTYRLSWDIEEQKKLTDLIQTQKESTILISTITLINTILQRKGLKLRK